MILSIGMIVKNEERYLRRCLAALSPILQQVESELIIADTGSTDDTVNIAREFTDNVFHFDWCDDFSAARNSTMKKAKGEWYFFIDADEILLDATALIDFFNSGAYKAFSTAAITIRSGNDKELSQWVDFQAVRLIKLKTDSFFINSVHEHFGRLYGPNKLLSVIANHYGYVTEANDEYITHKMNRNLQIILSELKKNPSNHMMYIHASNACNMCNDLENALKYCEEGLSRTKEKERSLTHLFYATTISINSRMGNHEKVVKLAEEYARCRHERLVTDLEISYLKAESCFLLKRYRDAIQSYLDYFETFKHGLKKAEDIFEHEVTCSDEYSYLFGMLRLANAYIMEDDDETAISSLHSLTPTDYQKSTKNLPYWLSLELALMKKAENYSGLIGLYDQLDTTAREVIQTLIENEILDPVIRGMIFKEIKTLNYPKDAYLWLLKLRSDDEAGSLAAAPVNDLLMDMAELTPLFADAAYFAVKTGLPLASISQKIDPQDIERFFYSNPFCHFNELAYLVLNSYGENTAADTHTHPWLSSLYFTELTEGNLHEDNVSDLFKAYTKSTLAAMTELLKNETPNEENIKGMPLQFRVGYYCDMAEKERQAGQNSIYVRYLRMALQICPKLNQAVQVLADQLNNNLESEKKRRTEFDAHAAKVKAMIQQLINISKLNDAAELIQAYEKLCPSDPEIELLKRRTASY